MKCKNCPNEAVYGDVCSDCYVESLLYRIENQKETIEAYQHYLKQYKDKYGKLEGMGSLTMF